VKAAEKNPAEASAGEAEDAPAPAPKKQKSQLFKAPEAAEVVEIARTRNLYKSNLFRLQLEELIKEMTPKKPPPGLEAALHALRPLLLEKLRARDIPADFAQEFPALRFMQRGGAAPSALRFTAPRRIDVVGSFLLGTYTKEELTVDVAVEMPSDIFRSKDYLNFRYHDKRAAYLAELHRQLCDGLLRGPIQRISGNGCGCSLEHSKPVDVLIPKFIFLFATDPPNVVEHYDDCFAAMQSRFPESDMIVFELPGFGMSHSARASMDDLACDLTEFVKKVKCEFASESGLVLVMPCVSALFSPVLLRDLPQGTVEHLVVVQCADYAGELSWANGVNARGMLSLPILARLYNYLNAKAISANWYKATFPKRGSYLECSGCRGSRALDAEGSLEHGADEARTWFSSVAGKAFDAGARFPLAWCLQQLFYAPPRECKLVGLLREGAATIKTSTLVVWGMQDATHRGNFQRELEAPSFSRYVSGGVEESAHFPELQHPQRFATAVFDFLQESAGKESTLSHAVRIRIDQSMKFWAMAVRSEPLVALSASFEALAGDPLRPCLCLQPEDDARWTIRLLPTYSADLWPDRNAVRPDRALENGGVPATAHYNSCVPLARNRFLLSMLAAHAANTAGVAPMQTSSFQLFKLTLSVLATTEWKEQKVTFGVAGAAKLSSAEAQVANAHFYDAEGAVNFLSRVGPVVEELQWEAKRALRAMDSQADPFEMVFGCQATPELAWDLCLRLPQLPSTAMCPDLRTETPAGEVPASFPADMPEALATAEHLRSVLRAGLDDRCVRSALRWVGHLQPRWTERPPETGPAVLVGLILAPENLERLVDRGPSAQDAAATKFRQLWGTEKSELRRFKDGSILECVVWQKPPAERTMETRKQPAVVTQIVQHLLTRHLPSQLAPKTDIISGPTGFVPNLAEKDRRLWAAFETFRTHLCQLSSLPLAVKDIHPVDASFSYMSIQSTIAPPAPSGSDAKLRRTLLETVLEFESSGRWPSEPAPAQKVGAALLLQIREELSTDLGIEADATEGFLDVRYPETVFRLRIFHPHELQEVANKVTGLQAQTTAAPGEAELERLRTLWWRPRLRASLHAHALQKPAMAGAARLFKRWMASQMMSGYDEFCEHLVSAVFLHPAPFGAPSSPHVGFCRALWLLDTFDWQREALIIDIDGKLTEEERLGLRQSFENRLDAAQKDASLIRFWVSTRLDPHALLLATPPSTVAGWLRRRAQEALRSFHARLLGLEGSWRQVFELDTSAFDVVLQLLPPLEVGGAPAVTQNGDEGKRETLQIVSAEAADALVQGLREKLSPVCLVFHDAQQQVVALKWRPSAFLPQPQNALMGSVPHTVIPQGPGEPPLCVPNVLCILATVSAMAEGMTMGMEVKQAL
ncbi:Nol6, partial [Symbiodinium microadriaticum]